MEVVQTDEKSLAALGTKASELLSKHDFAGLAQQFGYALSYWRDPAAAIEADFRKAASSPHVCEHQDVMVRYFEPNSSGLFAVIECFVPIVNNASVLLELIVSGKSEYFVTIEGISSANV